MLSSCHSYLVLLEGQRQHYSHCSSAFFLIIFFSCGLSVMPTSRESEKITDIAFTSPDLAGQSRVISPCQSRRGRRRASKHGVRAPVWATQCNFVLVLVLSCARAAGVGRSGERPVPEGLHLPPGSRARRLLDPLWASASHRRFRQPVRRHRRGDG